MMITIQDSGDNPTCVEELSWYHGGLNRNTAEALLLSNSGEGTYLVRDSRSGDYAVSARAQQSVKHFELIHNKEDDSFVFGVYTFFSFAELLEHFKQCPVLGNDSGGGTSVVLKVPYPNNIYEPKPYEDVTRQTENPSATPASTQEQDFHIGGKEGYLTKRGDFFKSWKNRWFVIEKHHMRYYTDKRAKPKHLKKEWDLKTLLQVAETSVEDKMNCFCLVFPTRTIYCEASSPLEVKEWVDFFQWKIDYYKSFKH